MKVRDIPQASQRSQLILDTISTSLMSNPALRDAAKDLHAFFILQPLGILLMSINTANDIYKLKKLCESSNADNPKVEEKKAALLRKLSFEIPALLLGYTSMVFKFIGVTTLMIAASYLFMAAASLALVYNAYELIYNIAKSFDENLSSDEKAEHRQEATSKAVSIAVITLVLAATILLLSNPIGIGCTVAAVAAGIIGGLILWEILKFVKPIEYSNVSLNQMIKEKFPFFSKSRYHSDMSGYQPLDKEDNPYEDPGHVTEQEDPDSKDETPELMLPAH